MNTNLIVPVKIVYHTGITDFMDSTSSELKNVSRTSIQVKLPSADQAVRHSPHGRSHHAGSPDAGRLFKEQSVSRRGHPQPVMYVQCIMTYICVFNASCDTSTCLLACVCL